MSPRSQNFATFFENAKDPDIFQFRGINLSKFFYDKWIDIYRQSPQKYRKAPWPHGNWLIQILYRIRAYLVTYARIFYFATIGRKKGGVLFYGLSGRHSVIDHQTYDLYNANLIDFKGRDQFILLEDYETDVSKQYQPDLYLKDLEPVFFLLAALVYIFLFRELQNFKREVRSQSPLMRKNFSNADTVVAYFYARYLVFKVLLSIFSISEVVMLCHYGRSPMIAAGHALKIPVTELMHGSIIQKHPNYTLPNLPVNFTQAIRGDLLPDRLGVYGAYWKNIVDHGGAFDPDNVFVAGYYLKLPPVHIEKDKGPKNVILISSQITVQAHVVNYVRFLKENLNPDEWRVIIKPHPAENYAQFEKLLDPGFIDLSLENIYTLLGKAHIHISVRSTVLYEAIQYKICNYVLLAENLHDECMEIVETGIARALQPNETPVLYEVEPALSEYYFARFAPESIFAPGVKPSFPSSNA